jgi:archaellum biogenesis protein FlaJ (TadC family)
LCNGPVWKYNNLHATVRPIVWTLPVMALQVTKPLAFVYWALRRLFRELSDDGYSDWKALAIISLVEVFLFVSAIFFISILLGQSAAAWLMHWKLYGAILISFGVVASNHYLLRFEDKWAQFEQEFNSYSRLKRALGYAVTTGVVLLALVLLLLSRQEFFAMARSAAL